MVRYSLSRRSLCALLTALLLALAPFLRGAEEPQTVPPPAGGKAEPLPAGAVLRLGVVRTDGKGKVFALALSPDGKVLASGHDDGTVQLWDVVSGKSLQRLTGGKLPVTTLAWLPKGRELLAGYQAGPVVLWDRRTGGKLGQVLSSADEPQGSTLALSPDGRTMAFGGWLVSLVDVRTGKGLRKLSGGAHPIFSLDGKAVLVGESSRESALSAWSIDTGELLRRFPWPQKREIDDVLTALAHTPDGRSVVGGFRGGTVRLWEAATGAPQAAYWTHPWSLRALAVSADGRYIATGGDDQLVRVRDRVSGWEVLRLRGHRDRVTAVAFTPDGRRIFSASADATILVWTAPDRAARERPTDLRSEQLEATWSALLGQDATAAYRASRLLLGAPARSVAFLRGKLPPAAPLMAGYAERLVAELNDARFTTRERAAGALVKLGRLAEPALRQALAANPTEELRRRATAVLARAAPEGMNADELRQWRALEVLEYAGTPEARRLLEELARGAPGALVTTWARETLERLRRHS